LHGAQILCYAWRANRVWVRVPDLSALIHAEGDLAVTGVGSSQADSFRSEAETLRPAKKSSIGVLSPRLGRLDGLGSCRSNPCLRRRPTESSHPVTDEHGLNFSVVQSDAPRPSIAA
jgi:hypothetical protein